MSISPWALSLSYWLHMLATVAWIGGLAAVSLITLPVIAGLSHPEEQLKLLHKTQKKLDPLGWFSLLLLTGTGLIQMSVSDQYEGVLTISNAWSQSILLKHIVFFGMVIVSGYLTWSAIPELSRAVLALSRGKGDPARIPLIQKKHQLLIRLNLVLGLVVLAFTALARVAA